MMNDELKAACLSFIIHRSSFIVSSPWLVLELILEDNSPGGGKTDEHS
jgi:hypothetical protein